MRVSGNCWWECERTHSSLENRLAGSLKVKNIFTLWSSHFSAMYLHKRNKNDVHTETGIHICRAAIFEKLKTTHVCTHRWMDKLWHICAVEYFLLCMGSIKEEIRRLPHFSPNSFAQLPHLGLQNWVANGKRASAEGTFLTQDLRSPRTRVTWPPIWIALPPLPCDCEGE